MKHRILILPILLLAYATAGLNAAMPAGYSTAPLAFGLTGRHIAQPVDWLTWCGDCLATDYTTGTPWVTNPTTCMWDTDDWFEYQSTGSNLAAGASTGIHDCSFESGTYPDPNVKQQTVIHAAYFDITAPSSSLHVSETFSWNLSSHSFTPSPVWNATRKLYEYKQCIVIEGVSNATWAAVSGSNGGYGVPVSISATVTNPTSRSVKSVAGVIQYGWQEFGAAGCQTSFPGPL